MYSSLRYEGRAARASRDANLVCVLIGLYFGLYLTYLQSYPFHSPLLHCLQSHSLFPSVVLPPD